MLFVCVLVSVTFLTFLETNVSAGARLNKWLRYYLIAGLFGPKYDATKLFSPVHTYYIVDSKFFAWFKNHKIKFCIKSFICIYSLLV